MHVYEIQQYPGMLLEHVDERLWNAIEFIHTYMHCQIKT